MSLESLIKSNGPLTIAQFMDYAMFSNEKSYYRGKKPIGKNSDFITAPEISSVFGQLIGAYFLGFILNSDEKIAFTEMGAGLGTLFFDVLEVFDKLATKLGKIDDLQNRLTFNIIEISEKLTQIQQQKLAKSKFKINWFKDFDEFTKQNQNRQIFFLANELFDCFPIQQFSKKNDKWQEVLVGLKNEKPTLILEEFSQAKHAAIEKIATENEIKNHNEIIFEHSFQGQNFMQKISQAIKKQGGMGIVIDYGYQKNPLKNTLQAIRNHQKTDIFHEIGDSDLTSLVNFSMLEKIAQQNKLQTSLLNQGDFLKGLGILEKKDQLLKNATSTQVQEIQGAISRLIDKDKMGELFKCLIFWPS